MKRRGRGSRSRLDGLEFKFFRCCLGFSYPVSLGSWEGDLGGSFKGGLSCIGGLGSLNLGQVGWKGLELETASFLVEKNRGELWFC